MSDINKAFFTGRLTKDAELRSTNSGTSILLFSVAVNDRVKNGLGEWGDYTNYLDCKMFGNRADALSMKLTKGTKVAVEGKLRWSQWEAEGRKRSKVEVMVDNVEFMQKAAQEKPQETYMDIDIPF